MGVTIECVKSENSIEMGYGGFASLREQVANLVGGQFALFYKLLTQPNIMTLSGEQRKKFFEHYNAEIPKIIKAENVPETAADFLYQSDCDGKIGCDACQTLLDIIGDYDDEVCYGYIERPDAAMFKDFKVLLEECLKTKSDLVWR